MIEDKQDVSWTHVSLVLARVNKMANAEEKGDRKAFFVNFKWFLRLTLPYIPYENRVKIEEDWQKLKKAIQIIKENENLNEQTKEAYILDLENDFAETHLYYPMLALTKIGAIKYADEGTINFDIIDFEILKQTIRLPLTTGYPSKLANKLEEKNKEVENANTTVE